MFTKKNQIYNSRNQYVKQTPLLASPSRPAQPKPPIPMEIDPSLHSHKLNYINRPNYTLVTRSQNTSNLPNNQQRPFHIEPEKEQTYEEQYGEEINFMMDAHQAFLT